MSVESKTHFFAPKNIREKRWLRLSLLVLSVLVWTIAGVLLTAIFFLFFPEPRPAWAELLGNCLAFLPLFLILPIAQMLLRQKVQSMISLNGKVRLNLVFLGFWSWGLLLVLESLYKLLLDPGSFRFTLDFADFIPTLLVGVIFISIQATSEEMLFRSAIPMALGSFVRNPYFIIVVSGLLFGLPHLANPEANAQFLVSLFAYSLTGVAWGWITYRTGGIELAIGAHVINNIYGLVIVGYDNSAVSTASIFKTGEIDMLSSLIQSAVLLTVWLLFLIKFQKVSE